MSRAGFTWQSKIPYSVKPSTSSMNVNIPTNPMPAKNAYRYHVHGIKFPERAADADYHVARQELRSAFDRVVVSSGKKIDAATMDREITRGTQKGFKTCTFGPHRPQIGFVPPNSNKDTGIFVRKPVGFEEADLGGADNAKFNIVASTYRGGMNPTASRLGRDLDGFEKEALIDFGNVLYTESKDTGGANRGGGRAGFRGQKQRLSSARPMVSHLKYI